MLETIFYEVDNFCKYFEQKEMKMLIGQKRNRKNLMYPSEIMTILIYFHHSKFRTFKDYYNCMIKGYLSSAFTNVLSYNRFITISKRYLLPLFIFSKLNKTGICNGISFIDSTSLKVCHNKRIASNKIFKGSAARGKTSMGWFFGYKLHFIINSYGEIIDFVLTSGNVSDANIKVINKICKKLFGKLFGDKGYLSRKIFDFLFSKGIKLFTKVRKNMKNVLLGLNDKLILKKRGLIESVGNLLKNKCQIEHSRHRSISGFFINVLSAISAYNFLESKPSILRGKMNVLEYYA
jgi:hypothetical protein